MKVCAPEQLKVIAPMSEPIKIHELSIDCHADGGTRIYIWCNCYSPDDIEDMIAWLKLAKAVMEKWQAIRKADA
jgi:hypothetical protein